LIEVEQQSDESQALMSRKVDSFLGDLFDAGGHERLR
jgi:hypothetical protein